ncbi:hypothetical protein AWQ21_05150 [Picosynechococcus sp. PCC 7003]|nr:hypothetical protein AWQ21_05150 [Picosynechococcus sp. PCC 7003]
MLFSPGAIAQEIFTFEPLPPVPPVIPLWEEAPASEPVFYDGFESTAAPGQEYIFEAPTSTMTTTTPSAFVTPASRPSARYRVEVVGSSPLMLATVRQVEPTAFVKGDRIQAGLFSERENAETLRANLQASGIAAQITDMDAGDAFVASSPPVVSSHGGYFIAIPSRGQGQDIQDQLRRMGIQQDLIEAKSAPRGPHIAIGPFAQREEAELMNVRVRLMDLDGRLYFQN